jgi:hypothetical protein
MPEMVELCPDTSQVAAVRAMRAAPVGVGHPYSPLPAGSWHILR